MNKTATIEYDNDTGPGDEGFEEWWTVKFADKSFRCNSEQDAIWLAGILNTLYTPPVA